MMKILTTDRLTLRPLKKEDGPLVAQYAGDWDVASMTERIPFPYEIDMANGWVENLADDFVFALEHEGDFIGCCGIAKKPNSDETELGYWLAKPWWRKGFATEAARAVANFAFEEKDVNAIQAGHFADNPASARVLEKVGFEATGEVCERYCEARKLKVFCVGFTLSKARAKEVGLII